MEMVSNPPELSISSTNIEGLPEAIQCWRIEVNAERRLRSSSKRLLAGFLQLNTADGEVGFGILSEFRGNGYAVAALSWLKIYARENTRFSSLFAVTSHGNFRAIRVLAKAGFVRSESGSDHESPDAKLLRFSCPLNRE